MIFHRSDLLLSEDPDSFLHEQTGERREDAESWQTTKEMLTLSRGQSEEVSFPEKSDKPLYEPV